MPPRPPSPIPRDAGATASAPGKLILSGEHAVVYGQPALLLAVDRRVRVRVDAATAWEIDVPGLPLIHLGGPAELERRRREIEAAYAEFLAGLRPIQDVARHPATLMGYACALVGGDPYRVRIESDVPLGSGMGSSAAVSAAVAAALLAARGRPADPDTVRGLAVAVERIQHGRPSGADVAAVVAGGLIRFEGGQIVTHQPSPARTLTLVDTGRPDSTTGECVEAVRVHAHDRGTWAAFGQITGEVASALADGDEARLIHAVRRNHRYLCRIGVVPEPVQAMACEIESAGGAAKICGAGAVRGASGGLVWALGPEPTTEALATRRGWKVLRVVGTDVGVAVGE